VPSPPPDLKLQQPARPLLEDVEEQNRRLISALGQIVYHYDVSASRMVWRGECAAILGFSPDEMPSDPELWKSRIHPKDTAALEAWAAARDGSETLLVREYRCLHQEGHAVWVLDRCVLTRGPEGNLLAADGVLLDISQQKQIESDLISARNAAEAADRAKSDFLAVMSHEIRTPMNGVIGCASLLLETMVTPEQKDYLHTICKCGDSLLHLINDILDFSKMESDKLTLERRPFSLRSCVEEVLDLYALMAAEKKIELLARFESLDLDGIAGDEVRLRQILVNLVGNALKFTAAGEVVVTLGRRPWLPGGEALMLTVRDTGIGISRDEQQRIFLPFSQADSSTTRKFGGTGLGLTICGHLATLMGGAITVYSEENRGSEFIVLIPLEEATEKNAKPASGPLFGRSALVVDDSASFREMMQALLESSGMRVTLAGDLCDVRAELDSGEWPDVLLLDGGLPDAMFTDVAGAIAAAKIPHVVELMVPSLLRAPQSAAIPFSAAIGKPVRRAELLKTLAGLFEALPVEAPKEKSLPGLLAERYPLKILIVEDNAINRMMVTGMLEWMGYHPQVVENGKLCVELLASESFDLVVMDVQMPEMDGYEATSVLRRRGDTTWITALTADAMPEDPLRCRIAGMNDYLSKPLHTETLRAAIERCALALKKTQVR
jgi:signal transduction histidine kinase/DNA-binding response OmpR family regulator